MRFVKNFREKNRIDWEGAALCALGFVILSLYVIIFTNSPINGEDFALTKDFGNAGYLERFHWIVQRSTEQASGWNARLGEQLAIFWLSLPRHYFTIVSAITFIALLYFTSLILSPKAFSWKQFLFATALVFPLWPGYELFFWRSVNAGYLQPLVICLFCLFYYSNSKRLTDLSTSKYKFIISNLAALLSGLSFENVPLAMMFFISGSVLLAGRAFLNFRVISPIFSMAIGWAALISAPSTTHRRNFYKHALGIENYTFEFLIKRILNVSKVFLQTSGCLFVLAILASIIVLKNTTERSRLLLFMFSAMMVCGSVIFAPYTEARAFGYAWAIMFSICVTGTFHAFDQDSRKLNWFLPIILFLYFPIRALILYREFATPLNTRDANIRMQLNNQSCQEGIQVPAYLKQYPYKYLNNREEWCIAYPDFLKQYYNCKILIK